MLANRGLGPEVVMQLAEQRAPNGWGPRATAAAAAFKRTTNGNDDKGAVNGADSSIAEAADSAEEQKVYASITDAISQDELEEVGRKYKAIAGFEVDAVNARASETEGLAEKRGLKAPKAWC